MLLRLFVSSSSTKSGEKVAVVDLCTVVTVLPDATAAVVYTSNHYEIIKLIKEKILLSLYPGWTTIY